MGTIIIQGLESHALISQGYDHQSYFEINSGGDVNGPTPGAQLPAAYYCRLLGRYVAAVYIGAGSNLKTRHFNTVRRSVAMLPAITVCNQKLLQIL